MAKKDVAAAAKRASAALVSSGSRAATTPIWFVHEANEDEDLAALTPAQRTWLESISWQAKAGRFALVPGESGELSAVVLGLGQPAGDAPFDPFLPGLLPTSVPTANYHFANPPSDATLASLSWLLGAYAFDECKSSKANKVPRLKLAKGVDRAQTTAIAEAVYLGRDLINRPANDFGPEELEEAARHLAGNFGAHAKITQGHQLLSENFPLIHAVGRASDREPRLIDLNWSGGGKANRSLPKVTLVGKGICFDTGGLNIKPGNSMLLMKKDMGGAAAALALAAMIMSAELPVQLRVLIPAAENSLSGNAYRPGDVIKSRAGTTVEIANTDAEGRLVLADALTLADEDKPDYLFSFATLTGSARVALGPDLPPLYVDDDALAAQIQAASIRVCDPLWRMPFWQPYDRLLNGKIGDVNHIYESPFAGSITAALFLKRFVMSAKRYAHLDIFGWVPSKRPARPRGGEPQGARAIFEVLRNLTG